MKQVISQDGTAIAYDVYGSGPALILVNGTMGSRIWGPSPYAQPLAHHFTVYDYDRRGRGDSTDVQPYDVQKEVQDIEALIAAAGNQVYMFGLSSGAALALQAAAQLGSHKITKLAMYEGPYTTDKPTRQRWERYGVALQKAAKDTNTQALVHAFLDFMETPPAEITQLEKDKDRWQKLCSLAPTLLYDYAVNGKTRAMPTSLARQVKTQTLVINGGASGDAVAADADMLAQCLPKATRAELPGETHSVSPEAVVPVLSAFFQK